MENSKCPDLITPPIEYEVKEAKKLPAKEKIPDKNFIDKSDKK